MGGKGKKKCDIWPRHFSSSRIKCVTFTNCILEISPHQIWLIFYCFQFSHKKNTKPSSRIRLIIIFIRTRNIIVHFLLISSVEILHFYNFIEKSATLDRGTGSRRQGSNFVTILYKKIFHDNLKKTSATSTKRGNSLLP